MERAANQIPRRAAGSRRVTANSQMARAENGPVSNHYAARDGTGASSKAASPCRIAAVVLIR